MTPAEDLERCIADGEPLVVIAGAGVSMATTNNHPHASWKGLLESGVER